MDLTFLEKNSHEASITLVGDVQTFVEGKVAKDKFYTTDPLNFQFALGGATLETIEEVGETIVVNQTAYVSRLSARGSLKCRSCKIPFDPFFLVGVSPHEKYSALIEIKGEVSINALYAALLDHYPSGFLIAGEGLFLTLEGAYVKRCPREGTPPLKQFNTYLGEEKLGHALGYMVGLVSDKGGSSPLPVEILGRIFYENPHQKGVLPFHSHTHVALITERDRGGIDIDRDISGARHLFPSSTITYGKIFLYNITNYLN